MERIKNLKETLMGVIESQVYGGLDKVDAKELGEVVDMVKDLDEALYYCTITKAMEEKEEEPKEAMYYTPRQMYYTPVEMYPSHYRDMDRDMGRMYYGGNGGSNASSNTGMRNASGNDRMYPMEVRDYREGKSPMSRRTYMEGKEIHKDKAVQMKELEHYMKELSEDLVEMVEDSTPEEKAILKQKLTTLVNKIQ